MNIAKVVLQNIAKGSGELAEKLSDDPFKKQRQTLSNASVTLNAILSEGQKEVKKAISIERRAALKAKAEAITHKMGEVANTGIQATGYGIGFAVGKVLKPAKESLVAGFQKA